MPADRPLNWDDLRYLRSALKAGSLAGAARSLRVEHTTVGRRLSDLEQALGTSLVVRGPNGLEPTALGRDVGPLLDEIDHLVTALTTLAVSRRNQVRLAVPTGLSTYLGAAVTGLRAALPAVSLEIVSGAQPVDLQKGEADLAVRIGPIADDTLIARKICDSGWSLYAARAHAQRLGRLDVDDLAGHPLIGYDQSLAGSPAARWIARHASGATIVMRVSTMSEMCAAAANGIGLAILPCALGEPDRALVRLTPRVLATGPVSIVYRRDQRQSTTLRAVVRFVVDSIAAHARTIAGEG